MSTRDSIANSDSHRSSSSVSDRSLRAVQEDCWARDRKAEWIYGCREKDGLRDAFKASTTLRLGGMYAKTTQLRYLQGKDADNY
jgi:hypothetical protein